MRSRTARAVIGSTSLFACCLPTAQAQEAPTLSIGDRWEWEAVVSPQDMCTTAFTNGAKTTETVVQVTDDGYRTETTGPAPDARGTRNFRKDFSYANRVNGQPGRVYPLKFPLAAGNTWDMTFASGSVVTDLKCKQDGAEKVKVGSEELDAVVATCTGNWNNSTSGNNGGATYKFWFSPAVGNMVRRSVNTLSLGRACSQFEFRMTGYTRAK